MMLRVNHQEAQEVRERQASKNGMVHVHWPDKEPARDQLSEPWFSWPGERSEEHASTLFVRERNVFRHLTRGPFAGRAGNRPPRGRDKAGRVEKGADCLAIGGDHTLEIDHENGCPMDRSEQRT